MAAVSRTRSADPIDPLDLPDERLLPPESVTSDASAVGRVNTPAGVARWMVREALDALPPGPEPPSILEPAAGSGVIIAALVERLSAGGRPIPPADAIRCIRAIDADPHIRPAAEERIRRMFDRTAANVLRSQYRCGDALLDDMQAPRGPIDVIISNPPFLGARDARRLGSFDKWREQFAFRGDLYAYFMTWAMRRVREGGIVCLLVPDTWLRLENYEHLRESVLGGRLLKLVRLPASTFARHVFPCFFVWQKAEPIDCMTRYVDARHGPVIRPTAPASTASAIDIAQAAYMVAPRRIIYEPTPDNRRLAAQLSELAARQTPKLGDFLHISDCGIHSRNCRHRLFFTQRERPGLKRLLQGRQIEPFAVCWDSPKARYRWVDITYEPQPGVRGLRTNGRPSVRDEYWDWQGDPAIHKLPQRILIRQTGDRIVAARCLQGSTPHYTDNTLFTALPRPAAQDKGIDDRFFVAYLNSEPASRLYCFLSGEAGRPQAQIKIRLLRELPFIVPPRRDVATVQRLVERIEAAARNGESAASLQTRLDAVFCRLFEFETAAMLPG
jgi:hypothetical protein